MRAFGVVRLGVMACLAGLLFSAVAEAQPPEGGGRGQRGQRGQRGPGGFGGGFGGGFRGPSIDRATLLRADAVREELKVDEGQGATIDAALQAFREESQSSRPDFGSFRDMSEEERRAAFEKMNAEREKLSKKTDEVLSALLQADQLKRLDQIGLQLKLQMSLTRTLQEDELKSKLSITEEQVAKLETVEEESNTKRREVFGQMFNRDPDAERPSREEMQAKMETLNKEITDSAMAVLTDAQKKSLEEMKGEAFAMDMRALFGGRGGPGGRGPGGPGGPGEGRGGRRGGDGGGRQRPAADDAI